MSIFKEPGYIQIQKPFVKITNLIYNINIGYYIHIDNNILSGKTIEIIKQVI